MTPNRVVTDSARIQAMSSLLSRLPVPEDSEESSVEADTPKSVLPDLYFVVVAICHQTSPRGEPPLAGTIDGQHFGGWDYLREAFLRAARRDASVFRPERLAEFSDSELNGILQIATEPVGLNSLPDRAALVRDLGVRMQRMELKSLNDLFIRCDGTLLKADGSGLLSEIATFHAYRDPVKKKTAYFLALMQNQGLWKLRDPENLPAPVDYHEVRGHLRCGTVALVDSDLAARIAAGTEVSEEEDILIRGTVADAIASIAKSTALTPSRLHYLFWNIFRNCCKRDSTHCDACPPDCNLPDRYKALTVEARMCLFSGVCESRGTPQKLIEHNTRTDYY